MKEERRRMEVGGGKIYVLMRTEGERRKNLWEGEEGKSLYGGASERDESALVM